VFNGRLCIPKKNKYKYYNIYMGRKYSDYASYITFGSCIPFIIVKSTLFALPTFAISHLSNKGYINASNNIFNLTLKSANCINIIEKKWIYFLSNILYPYYGYINYKNNLGVIKFLENNIPNSELNYDLMSTNIKYATQKEGSNEVFIKLLLMFSILPTCRHSMLNNPYLFKYQLYLTNQESCEFNDIKKMCKCTFGYVNNPDFILSIDKKKYIDDIGFTPNYPIMEKDNIINHNNVGLQVAGKYTTMLNLDYIHKNYEQLYDSILNKKYNDSFMHSSHPIYNQINKNIGLIKNVNNDELPRNSILNLSVKYDDMYHVVTGLVEVNIKNNNIVEHPMLCLTHDGSFMNYCWDHINDLFTNRVMKYLNELE
jgi:hypothetical protein